MCCLLVISVLRYGVLFAEVDLGGGGLIMWLEDVCTTRFLELRKLTLVLEVAMFVVGRLSGAFYTATRSLSVAISTLSRVV